MRIKGTGTIKLWKNLNEVKQKLRTLLLEYFGIKSHQIGFVMIDSP